MLNVFKVLKRSFPVNLYCHLQRSCASHSQTPKSEFSLTKFANAVNIYVKLYGDPWISNDFVVQNNDLSWPPLYHNYQLGEAVIQYRFFIKYKVFQNKYRNSAEIELLNKLQFIPNESQQWNLLLHKNMSIFRNLYPNLVVSNQYIIPETNQIHFESSIIENPFPKGSRGLSFGRTIKGFQCESKKSKIFSKRLIEDLINPKIIGISNRRTNLSNEQIIQAFQIYYNLHGNYQILARYKIPENDKNYPKILHNYKLGRMYSNVINGKCNKIVLQKAIAIGIQVNPDAQNMIYDSQLRKYVLKEND